MTQSSNTILTLSTLSGAAAHALLYRHGEWDLEAHRLVISYILILVGAIALQNSNVLDDLGVLAPPHWAVKVVGCHILGIYTSILLYRGFLHRLSKFPGPFFFFLRSCLIFMLLLCRLRGFSCIGMLRNFTSGMGIMCALVWNLPILSSTQSQEYQINLFNKGPTELSISDPSAVKAIYSAQSKVSKCPPDDKRQAKPLPPKASLGPGL